jgi:lysophospholipase L1-like esterase
MKHILIILCTIFLTATVDAAQFVAPDGGSILYTGRWDHSNAAQPWAYAKGTSIIANFSGTSLSATFSASSTDYLRVIIDDDAANSVKIQVSSCSVSCLLASGLRNSGHKIEIVKETDAGRWTFHGFDIEGVINSRPDSLTRKLVFYGDSNLAGYSLEHEENQSGQSLRGSYYGYAGITSRMLNAEYSNISRSGATVNSLHTSYDRIDWFTPGSLWNFPDFQPDAVVINIGANDVGRPKRKIKKDYHALLDDMRVAYPYAHIMLYNAWGWDYKEPANYIDEVIAERVGDGDKKMSFEIFPWLFEQWHGCEYDHSGMAHILADHLADVLGWIPDDADVMNGYGIDGDVANGSFEEIAPFLGYGWRYHADSGVSREHDPAGTDYGEYYLRLANGAASHQPNPAFAGDTFNVTVSMRGAENTDKVDMIMDFRDQNMWTDPLQSATQTAELTTEWGVYEMCATAPSGTAKPVYHTRLTFQAAAGSTVDIDNVSMSLTNEACGDLPDPLDPPDPPGEVCVELGDSCTSGSDCCSGRCSKGKPSNRVCLE